MHAKQPVRADIKCRVFRVIISHNHNNYNYGYYTFFTGSCRHQVLGLQPARAPEQKPSRLLQRVLHLARCWKGRRAARVHQQPDSPHGRDDDVPGTVPVQTPVYCVQIHFCFPHFALPSLHQSFFSVFYLCTFFYTPVVESVFFLCSFLFTPLLSVKLPPHNPGL